ncbi:permease [marine bacterium AO1-C]|nr:permease [marine bacterium AO1-C]
MEESNYQDGAYIPFVGEEPLEARRSFIEKTYTFLAIEVLVFILVTAVFIRIEPLVQLTLTLFGGWWVLLFLMGYMAVLNFAENWAMSTTSKPSQYAAMGLYIIAEAFFFTPLLFIAKEYAGVSVINQAAMVTVAMFLGITAIAFTSKRDYSHLRNYLMLGGSVALGLIFAGVLFGFSLGIWFAFGMVALASVAILYQTSNILHKYHTGQHVAASLGLFGSVMLLFWYVLNIFMSGD